MAPPAGALSRRPSWRPSGWNPNKAPAATKTSSLPACTKLLPLQARSTRRRSTGQGEACHALHVASHLAPRPPPSHSARRHLTSATSPPPRRSRKGVRDAAQRSPLIHPPTHRRSPLIIPPPRTHTLRGRACVELRSSNQLPDRELRSSSQEAPRRPTWRTACTQLPNRATYAHAKLGAQRLNRSVPSSQWPHRATSHRRELTGAQRPFAAPMRANPAQKAGWAHLPPSAWRVASIAWRSASACEIGGPGFVSAS
jgi:hypothetical protein